MPTWIFAWIIRELTYDRYLAWLKVGGVLCGIGDMAAVIYLLKLAEEATGERPARRIATVRVCMAASLFQLLPDDVSIFFIVMFAVFAVPYAILAYTALRDAPKIADFVVRHVGRSARDKTTSI